MEIPILLNYMKKCSKDLFWSDSSWTNDPYLSPFKPIIRSRFENDHVSLYLPRRCALVLPLEDRAIQIFLQD
jgi:hypothetical protein